MFLWTFLETQKYSAQDRGRFRPYLSTVHVRELMKKSSYLLKVVDLDGLITSIVSLERPVTGPFGRYTYLSK